MTSSELQTPPLDTARRLAEHGDLDGAAAILADLAATGGPDAAQAAVGLAVVLDQAGDVEGARAAARAALATGHPEFAAQAACHLAQGFEREGRLGQARGAWQAVLGVGTPAYVPLAHLALARLALESGELDEAESAFRAALDTAGGSGGHDGSGAGVPEARDGAAGESRGAGDEAYGGEGYGAAGAYGAGGAGDGGEVRVHAVQQLADLLIERGEPGEAADLLLEALRDASGDDAARLRVQLGIAHLELACAEFAGAVEDGGEAQTSALAIELLARTLPLRGRADDADHVWAYGLDHEDETLASEVRLRYDR